MVEEAPVPTTLPSGVNAGGEGGSGGEVEVGSGDEVEVGSGGEVEGGSGGEVGVEVRRARY